MARFLDCNSNRRIKQRPVNNLLSMKADLRSRLNSQLRPAVSFKVSRIRFAPPGNTNSLLYKTKLETLSIEVL